MISRTYVHCKYSHLHPVHAGAGPHAAVPQLGAGAAPSCSATALSALKIFSEPHFACGAQGRDPIPQFRSWALEQGLLTDGKIKVSLHTLPPATQLLTPCCSQCRKQCVAVWYFC